MSSSLRPVIFYLMKTRALRRDTLRASGCISESSHHSERTRRYSDEKNREVLRGRPSICSTVRSPKCWRPNRCNSRTCRCCPTRQHQWFLASFADISYSNLQAVTCVKLYSLFSDTLLQRTYVHHSDGFDLMASETPQRLTMPLQKWLPCRYLVSYSWPVASKRMEKDEDFVTRYYKSRKSDKPFIATLSHDKTWIAATYTKETGNLWTNPERSCQHADPSINLNAGETKHLELKTFIIKGNLEQLLKIVNREMKER